MAREHLKQILSQEEQDLGEVWEWYVFQRALIGEEAARTLDALLTGSARPDPRYMGKTRGELAALFDDQRRELSRVTMLVLLTATEAALRIDFIVRVMQKKKDGISRAFAALYKKQKLAVSLEDDILAVWWERADTPQMKAAIGEFRGALRLRHWLAHGRYWKPRLARDYDAQDVFALCDALLRLAAIR